MPNAFFAVRNSRPWAQASSKTRIGPMPMISAEWPTVALPNGRGGGRFCAGEVSLTGLGENRFARGEFRRRVRTRREADAGAGGHADGPLRRDFDLGFEEVGFPGAAAGGNVAGKRK